MRLEFNRRTRRVLGTSLGREERLWIGVAFGCGSAR